MALAELDHLDPHPAPCPHSAGRARRLSSPQGVAAAPHATRTWREMYIATARSSCLRDRRSSAVKPPSARLRSVRLPPCACATSRAIDRPSPVPRYGVQRMLLAPLPASRT